MHRDVVKFEKGAILRREMLESLYNYPHFLAEGYYSLYGDGILYGLEWSESGGRHFISPGALKYKGEIYFQPETVVLEEAITGAKPESDQEYYIFYRETPVKGSYCQEIHELELSAETSPVTDGFCYKYVKYEFGRFRALDNKKIFGLFASHDRESFSIPAYIIRNEVMPVLLKKKAKHPMDYEIMKGVYDNRPLSAEFAGAYIAEYNMTASERLDEAVERDNVRAAVNALIRAVQGLELKGVTFIGETEKKTEPAEEFKGGSML